MRSGLEARSGEPTLATRVWSEHRLTDHERSAIEDSARAVDADPYRDPSAFRAATGRAWNMLDPSTRQIVRELGAGTSARPELHITNLPESEDLPPTPTLNGAWEHTTGDRLSEFVMVTFSHGVGLPISYRDQRAGKVFHDIFPTAENAAQTSSQSSGVILGQHTEMFFHPAPPDHLMLHCLRPDPDRAARTFVSALHDIEARLPAVTQEILRTARFALDLADLHGSYTHRGCRISRNDPRPIIPILNEHFTPRFRFEPELMTPIGLEAAAALEAAQAAAREGAVAGTLDTGSLLIVDNRRASHARSSFPARFDGRDRWLRRMMLGRSPEGAATAVLDRHDLELVDMWIGRGATMDTVPYRTDTVAAP